MSTPNAPQQPTTPLPQGAQHTQPTTPLPPQNAGPQPGYAPPPQQPGRPAYPAPAYQPRPLPPQGSTILGNTNTYAFLAIIFAFLSPIAGIVFGHMGLSQIKRTGDAGRGIALTGLIISYCYFAFLALLIILYVGFIIAMIGSIGALGAGLGSSNTY